MPIAADRVAWPLALTPLAVVGWHVADAPAPVVLGAALPAVCHLGALLWIARAAGVRLRPGAAAFAFVWGAGLAAPVAAMSNDLLQAHVAAGGWRLAVLSAPPLEEAAKAGILIALVAVWRAELRDLRAGIVIGGLVGLGFGLAENVDYFLLARVQEGPTGLVRAIAIRGFLEGGVHPVFAGSMGAGLGVGRATARRRALPALLGFGAAVAQHALWNGAASPAVSDILCNGVGPAGACRGNPDACHLFVVLPAIVAAALAPGVVTLVALARRAGSPAA